MEEPATGKPSSSLHLLYGSGLTLSTALQMLAAAEEEATRLGVSVAIAVVDHGGHLLAFHRMDNAYLGTIEIAINKAFTAVFHRRPTQAFYDLIQPGMPLFGSHIHSRYITFGGGYPITREGRVIGGIGVSGGSGLDDISVARAGLAGAGFVVDEADADLVRLTKPQG